MKIYSLLFPVLGYSLLFTSCTVSSNERKEDATPKVVPVTNLIQKDTVIFKEYIADIQSLKNVEIRSRLAGFLNKIYVDEGASVKKGQVLFSIMDDEYKADHAQAEASLNTTIAEVKKVELELERTKKLLDKNIVSKSEYDLLQVQLKAAESKVKEAEAILNQAKTKLANTQIRAPFDGRIDRLLLKEGSLLEEGSLLTSISDQAMVNVYFDISETEYLNMVSGSNFDKNTFRKEVQLVLANGQLYPFKGEAALVESEFEASTGSISLRARFDNPDGMLKHGATGRIAVPTKTGNLLMVHQKSVFEIQDKAYVYTLSGDTVKMTPFKNGQRVGHFYVVEEGIPTDSKVVYEGVQSLRDGMIVQPKLLNN